MKADVGDLIKLDKKVCYGTVNGLVEANKGKILQVTDRNSSDDGVLTTENIHVWDNQYVIERSR